MGQSIASTKKHNHGIKIRYFCKILLTFNKNRKKPLTIEKIIAKLEGKEVKTMQMMQHNIKLVERNSQLAPKADRLFAAYTGCGYGQKLHR